MAEIEPKPDKHVYALKTCKQTNKRKKTTKAHEVSQPRARKRSGKRGMYENSFFLDIFDKI